MLTISQLYKLKKEAGEVGIEIEMEGAGLGVVAAGWGLHNDGSLRPSPECIEYVLNAPVSRKDVTAYLQNLQLALDVNSAKLSPSDRCGVHVHVNCQTLTINQTINFIITYLILEELLVKWCGEDREGNLFALRACDAEYIIPMLINSAYTQTFNTFSTEHRYSSINVASLMKFGSLEFRPLRTPVDFSNIDTWTQMLLNIKDYALAYTHPKNIIEEVSAGGFSKFPKHVLGDLSELVMCKGATGMIIEGVRRVQEIAYADLIYKKKEAPNLKQNDPQLQEWVMQGLGDVANRYNNTAIFQAPMRAGAITRATPVATEPPAAVQPVQQGLRTRAQRDADLTQTLRDYQNANAIGEMRLVDALARRYTAIMTERTEG